MSPYNTCKVTSFPVILCLCQPHVNISVRFNYNYSTLKYSTINYCTLVIVYWIFSHYSLSDHSVFKTLDTTVNQGQFLLNKLKYLLSMWLHLLENLKILSLHLRLRDHCTKEARKCAWGRKREFMVRLCALEISEATPMKYHQHCFLKRYQKMTIELAMLIWKYKAQYFSILCKEVGKNKE